MEGCPVKVKSPVSLRKHFMFRHWKSKVAILQEGPETLLWCDKCGMHMQADRLFKYWQSEKFHKYRERRLWRRDVDMAVRCG